MRPVRICPGGPHLCGSVVVAGFFQHHAVVPVSDEQFVDLKDLLSSRLDVFAGQRRGEGVLVSG